MGRWVSSRALDIEEERYNPFHDDVSGKFAEGDGGSNLDATQTLGGGHDLKGTQSLGGASEQLKGVRPAPGSIAEKAGAKGFFGKVTEGVGLSGLVVGKTVSDPTSGQKLKIKRIVSKSQTHVTVAGQLQTTKENVTRTFGTKT